MPLEFLRFAPTGPRDPRETAQKCNNLGEAAARQIAAIEGRLDLLETLIQEMVISAGGAMTLAGSRVGTDITAYQPITNYDTIAQTARGVTFDLVAGTFIISPELLGKWDIDIQIALTFNSTGQSRSVNIRLFNVTDALQVGDPVTISVSSQDDSISEAILLRGAILAETEGDALRLEIGGGSTFTGVNWETQMVAPFYKDRLTALIDPVP